MIWYDFINSTEIKWNDVVSGLLFAYCCAGDNEVWLGLLEFNVSLPPWPGFDPSFSGHNDKQSSASGQNYASDHSAIGAGGDNEVKLMTKHRHNNPVIQHDTPGLPFPPQ